jgi:hypothetical protein
MRSFYTTIRNIKGKSFVSEATYLTKMSQIHAFNAYSDDDKEIDKSIKEQNKINIKKDSDNELFTDKSKIHALTGLQDEDAEIEKSIKAYEQNLLYK